MKILIATPLYPPDIGGPAKYAKELVAEFQRQGITTDILVWGKLERLLPWGLRHAVYFVRLLTHMRGVDVVLALDTTSVGLPSLWATRLLHTKFMVRVGGDMLWEGYIERTGEMIRLSEFYIQSRHLTTKERVLRRTTRQLTQWADILFFNTAWQMQIWHKAYGFELAKAQVLENVYPPVQAEGYSGKKTFVAAGRSIKYKNIAALEDVFVQVMRAHPDVALDTKPLPSPEHKARVAKSYAVVVPSVSEVNSNIIIEGIALGKPFITTSDSGMHERLQDLGLFVDTLDPSALSAAVETILDEEKYKTYVDRIEAFSYTHSMQDIASEILARVKKL